MPGAFFGIHIASQALRAFETALNVTGHNLANVNTQGYSRQLVTIEQTQPTTFFGIRPFTMGSGAFVEGVYRARDAFIDGRIRQVGSEQSRLDQMVATLRDIEQVFGEPGSDGIASHMSAMFDSFARLAANPADEAARLDVRLKAGVFANKVRETNAALISLNQRRDLEVQATITEINSVAATIESLNDEIRQMQATQAVPNDLLDRRDLAMERLSSLVDARSQLLPDGTLTVFVGQHTLVSQVEVHPLPSQYDAATSTVTDGTKVIDIRNGRLRGLFGGIVATENALTQLSTLASEVRDEVNALHQTGTNLNGTTGIDFFAGTLGASDFDLSADIKADVRNIAAGTSGEPGDGTLAAAIAKLRDLDLAALGNRSPLEYYTDFLSVIGQDGQSFAIALDAQDATRAQLENQRQSISGVNVDEELANMMKYQRAYQAAAKVLTILDQTTEELIQTFGR